MPKDSKTLPDIAAHCLGVDVPRSPFLHEGRIKRINEARYEGQEIAGALHVVRPGDSVLELGAGIGVVGAVVSMNCKPKKVLSYEANPALIPHITALYKMNGLARRHQVRNEVLVSGPERPKTIPFYVHNSFLGSSLSGNETRAREMVDVATADFETVRADLKPDVMLIDIEGGELELLTHANLEGIRAIVIEFHPKAYEVSGMRQCKNILRDAGFAPVPDLSSRMVWVAERNV